MSSHRLPAWETSFHPPGSRPGPSKEAILDAIEAGAIALTCSLALAAEIVLSVAA